MYRNKAFPSFSKVLAPGRRKDNFCYLLALLSAWLLLNWVGNAPDAVLRVLLYPHKRAAELFYHTILYYREGIGYQAWNSGYVIGRECMGYRFILLLYAMNACTYVRHFTGFRKLLWISASLAGAIPVGLFASILRIIGSIPFVLHKNFPLIHLFIGTFLYLFVLIVDYAGLNKLFGRIRYEK